MSSDRSRRATRTSNTDSAAGTPSRHARRTRSFAAPRRPRPPISSSRRIRSLLDVSFRRRALSTRVSRSRASLRAARSIRVRVGDVTRQPLCIVTSLGTRTSERCATISGDLPCRDPAMVSSGRRGNDAVSSSHTAAALRWESAASSPAQVNAARCSRSALGGVDAWRYTAGRTRTHAPVFSRWSTWRFVKPCSSAERRVKTPSVLLASFAILRSG